MCDGLARSDEDNKPRATETIQNRTYTKKTLRDFQSQGVAYTPVMFHFFKNLLSLSQWRHGYFGLKGQRPFFFSGS